MDEDVSSLTIHESTCADAGLYTVIADNEAGSVSQSVSVNVRSQPEITNAKQSEEITHEEHLDTMAPVVSKRLEPTTVDVGEVVTLTCKFEGQF